jgi:hypothetical protein
VVDGVRTRDEEVLIVGARGAAGAPVPGRRRQPEKAEQAAIVRLLRLVGAEVWVLGTRRPRGDYPGTRQSPGLPDLIASLPTRDGRRRRLEVEVKVPGGRLSPAQRRYREHALASGIDHVVGDVDAVVAYLAAGGWIRG